MRRLYVLTFICAAFVVGADHPLDSPLPVSFSGGELCYDDGTAYWLSSTGTYKGTWFDVDDFIPGSPGWTATYSELWFYHHSSYPWDTSSFHCELWDGGISSPSVLLDETTLTAIHYGPSIASYSPMIFTEPKFWIIINTEMSTGGWPSVLGDNTPNSSDHSFYSDDFEVWVPWVIQGPTTNDYIIRSGEWLGLKATTWGSIKTLF